VTSGFLIDTSTLSLLSPGRRPDLPEGAADKLRAHVSRLYLSTITLAEIRQGICKLRRNHSTAKADAIEEWMLGFRAAYGDRVLPFGVEAAEAAGEISDAATAMGRHPGFPDVAIAGTAQAHDLTILTENVRHFEPLGVPVYNLAGMP
jgi:predicted nucleic acid-binding protein